MRFIRGLVVALLLPGSPSWAVPDEPIPEPSAKEEVPDWKREAEDLEARAAKAEEKQDLATALELRQAAVKVLREKHPESPEMASALSQAASTLCPLSREAEALPLYKESLAMCRRIFNGDHVYVAGGLGNLALTLSSLGRAAEALPLHEESLAMLRRLFRGDHAKVAESLGNLANTLRVLGRAAEALPLLDESLAMRRRLFKGDHRAVATSLDNLASVLKSL
ncbi:MAG: tetratricopeptide repeat protein, partial [Planctomycetes bacterium]|nr:tetratricopeptide repeat protein [Planctomycetota bacterium]